MTKHQINSYLHGLERILISNRSWQKIQLSREWTKQFPKAAGVYLIRENGVVCYVGETGLLRSRMRDLLETRNHVLRRKIGYTKYSNTTGYQKATSSKKFNPEVEEKINRWIQSHLEISTLVVGLGRKELEEYIYDKYDGPKYNSKGKRV